MKRIPLDVAPVEWACIHCKALFRVSDDPEPLLRHLALYCSQIPEHLIMNAAETWQHVLHKDRDGRAVAMHMLKHPDEPMDVVLMPSEAWRFKGERLRSEPQPVIEWPDGWWKYDGAW